MNTNKSFEIQLDDGRARIIDDGMTRIRIDVYVWLVVVCVRYSCVGSAAVLGLCFV